MLRMPFLQGGEDDELMAPQNISASNQKQRARKYYKEYDKLGCDLMDMWRRPASIGESSKLVRIAEFIWESQATSPIHNSIRVQFRIKEKSTLKLMLMSHPTSNQGVLRLVGKIMRLSFQWDWSHI
jgi:hypothetical protein